MEFDTELLIRIVYFVAAVLFVFGLKVLHSSVAKRQEITTLADTKATEESPASVASTAVTPAATSRTLASAKSVIIVPGYGMALSKAQHRVWELAGALQEKGIKVSFAVSPVAGRTPGHMDVLLAEAGVPYEIIHGLEDINAQFPSCDVALLIGANDVVNPAARTDTSSSIYGIPTLDADRAPVVFIIKRGQGAGFSGVENTLFSQENTQMITGDAQEVVQKLITDVKLL